MATLGFPSNPSTGTVYTVGTRTWIWTGQGWKVDSGNTALNTLTAVSVIVTTSTNSTSTDSGAIKVVGGVGIGKDLTVGGSVFISQTSTIGGYEILTTATVNQYANQTSIIAGTDTAVSTSTGAITIWNISTLQSVTDRGNSTTNSLFIDNLTVSNTSTSGALVVTGGVGVGGDLYVAGDIFARKLTIEYTTITTTIVETDDIIKTSNSTNAETTDTGALTVVGGIGVGKDAWIGGQLNANSIYVYSTDTQSKIYGPVILYNETSSTSINDGALQVYGGVGIRGDLYVGNVISNGLKVLTSNDGNTGFVSSIIAGEDISVSSATGIVTVSNISTFQSVTNRGATTTNALTILNYDNSTSSDTGALRVSGGVGVLGDIYSCGRITAQNLKLQDSATVTNNLTVGSVIITSTENATTTGTGALRISGGMSIAGNIYSSADVYANGYLVNTGTFTGGTLSNKTKITNSETSISTDTGALQVVGGIGIGSDFYAGGVGNFDHIITRGTATSEIYGPLRISDYLFVNSYYDSYSSTSGALIVSGGVGIGGSLNVQNGLIVGGSVTATNFYGTFNGFISATGTVTTSSFTDEILGGNPGELVYQIGPDQTGFVTTSTPGDILVSNGADAPLYQNTLTLSGTQASISTDTGALQVTGGAGIGGNLYVGGTVKGNYLQIAGFDQVSTVSGFLDVGTIKAIAPIDVFNASSTDTGALQVVGGVGIGGNVYIGQNLYVAGKAFLNEAEILTTQSGFSSVLGISVVNQTLSLTTTTNSTSTDSGALIVAGGVGIGKDLYVGGDLTLKGALVITTASIGSSAVTSITAGTDTVVSSYIGDITIWNNSTLQTVSDRGNSTTNAILVANTADSLSTDTGALQVVGGVGIGGDAWVGGDVYTRGQKVLTTSSVNDYANQTTIIAGTDTAVSTSTGAVTIWNTSTLQTVSDRGNSTTNAISISNVTLASSTDTGALTVAGGVGIGGDLYVGGKIVAQELNIQYTTVTTTIVETDDIIITYNDTAASSTDSGALRVIGGVGIGGNAYIGGDLNVQGSLVVTTATISSSAVTSIIAGTDTAVYGTVGSITIWNTSTLQTITDRGNSTTNAVLILNTSASTSTTTGALTVAGGVGVELDMYVGGDIFSRGSQVLTFANTASLISSSAGFASTSGFALSFNTGTLVNIALSATTSSFASTSGFALSFNTGTLVNIAIFASSSTYADVAGVADSLGTGTYTIVNSTVSIGTDSGALTVVGGVGVGGQINAQSIVAGGVRSTTGSSSPPDPIVGDMWYNTNNDRMYRYTANGVIDFWLDYTGPVVQYPTIF